MKGKILDYNFQDSKGIISGDDGNRYYFENSEWKGSVNPKIGQVVDFEINGQNAKGIYLVKTSVSFDGVADKLGDLNAQEKVDVVKDKLSTIKNNGIQNKFGFIVSIILAIFMFIPVARVNFGFGSIEASVIDGSLGYLAFLGVLVSAFLFYTGGKQIFTKIATGIVTLIVLLFLKDIVSTILDIVEYSNAGIDTVIGKVLNITFVLLIILIVLYVISAFKKLYKEIGVNNEG